MATPLLETEVQRVSHENYSSLVLAIIENGVTDHDTGEGTSYLDTDGGKYWCGLLDIDASWLQRMFIAKGYLCRLSPRRWK
jgi:hypothetical protein